MLKIKQSNDGDYKQRWKQLDGRMIVPPDFRTNAPLQIKNRAELDELSFAFFVGWLFTSALNQQKQKYSCSFVPVNNGSRCIFCLYPLESNIAIPSRSDDFLLVPQYFECPLDRLGRDLTDTEKHLCPVVNKIRYNLSHSRTDYSVDGLKEPSKTAECCASKKQALWDYLNATIVAEPDMYGIIVGSTAFPINLEFDLLKNYLTGTPATTDEFGKLLEETLLWYAMGASGILIGSPHCSITGGSTESYEIDILLYDTPENKRKSKGDILQEKIAEYISDQSILILELTVGHIPEPNRTQAQQADENEYPTNQNRSSTKGKDRATNKLLNYLALKSFGFKNVQTQYISIIGGSINDVTRTALTTTEGFTYRCLSDVLGIDIREKIISHPDSPIPVSEIRAWHRKLIELVEIAGTEFKTKLAQN